MNIEIKLVFCVLVVLTGSSQTRGQRGVPPPVFTLADLSSHTGTSAPPDLTEDPGNEVTHRTHNPAGRNETTETTTLTQTDGTVLSETKTHLFTMSLAATTAGHTDVPSTMTAHRSTPSPPAASDSLSSTPVALSTSSLQHSSTTDGRTLLTSDPLTTFSSQPAHAVQEASSAAPTYTTQSESLTTATTQTTGGPQTSAPGRAPAGPTRQDVPSELNVGDEDLKRSHYRSSSPLDPLLAGLLSVFIVTTAIVFVVLFLKFRQRTNHPEFHRLQDLPMDDLMEDTPLSRYSY
ncbi:hyphal wall protein 1-like [Parambassis ranga]|uniref:Hyphal wall protein 1-like n=1 Tax=Parambassis ranga TaxID=210632 RepID=A0A6P7JZY3_9TELE|nr:hyphal wall protein 1-like [Parambassis ranga]